MQTAVSRGQRLDDERLRRAAADLARAAQTGLRWRGTGRGRRVLLVLVGLWLLLQVLGVLTALVRGDPGDVPWVTSCCCWAGPSPWWCCADDCGGRSNSTAARLPHAVGPGGSHHRWPSG